MRKTVAALVLTVTAGLMGGIAPAANAFQVEAPERKVKNLHLDFTVPVPNGRIYVELNDGSTYILKPCRLEDSRHCYWNARKAGNGKGKSFVRLRGRIMFV